MGVAKIGDVHSALMSCIIQFVQATTDAASPKFVPPEARIATFDQDRTARVEQPIYTQVMYCLDRVRGRLEWTARSSLSAQLLRPGAS